MLLYTPNEIIDKLIQKIERKRIEKNVTQKELCESIVISLSTYKRFITNRNINFVSLIEILFFLDMESELKSLFEEPRVEMTYEELKQQVNTNERKRVRK